MVSLPKAKWDMNTFTDRLASAERQCIFVLRFCILLFAHSGCVNVVFQNFTELSPMDKSYLEMMQKYFLVNWRHFKDLTEIRVGWCFFKKEKQRYFFDYYGREGILNLFSPSNPTKFTCSPLKWSILPRDKCNSTWI